jgi:hypothetical protein
MRRFTLGFLATLLLLSASASAGSRQFEPSAVAGAVCTFGPYHYGAIGLVLDGAPDRPGIHGNEIKQVYRVFYRSERRGRVEIGFAGWLAATFDGYFWFTPSPPIVGIASTWNSGLAYDAISVVIVHPNRLPLVAWVSELRKHAGVTPRASMLDIIHAHHVVTALSPCFAHDWNGRPT